MPDNNKKNPANMPALIGIEESLKPIMDNIMPIIQMLSENQTATQNKQIETQAAIQMKQIEEIRAGKYSLKFCPQF